MSAIEVSLPELAKAGRAELTPDVLESARETLSASLPGARGRFRIRAWVAPYVLIAPGFALIGVFVIVPMLAAIPLSLVKWNLLSGSVRFVGSANYATALSNGELLGGLRRTLLYVAMTVPVSVALGLLIALAINAVAHGRWLWRMVFFLPTASMLAVMSIVWRWLFYPQTGLVAALLSPIAGDTAWLSSRSLALPALAIVGNWHSTAFTVMIFLAGLASVPTRLHDAAAIDGASSWSRFWHVTWPALGPTTLFAVVVSTIAGLRVFDQVSVMTQGGPNEASATLAYEIWRRGVQFLDIGGASALTVTLVVLVIGAAMIQLVGLRRSLESRGRR